MNIFATYPDPEKAARVLDDARLVKMVLESMQLLSTATHLQGKWKEEFPRPTHHGHPCTVWTAEGRENFEWLWEHAWEMDKERRKRFNRSALHRTLNSCYQSKLHLHKKHMPVGSTPHANCARNAGLGVDYTHIQDTHLAYRLYLSKRWELQARPAICSIIF